MKKIYPTISHFFPVCIIMFCMLMIDSVKGQQTIAWQQSIGTIYSDNAFRIFNDEDGNMVIVGDELHSDFTGNLRRYMMISKISTSGQQIWKTYHDLPYETFSLPLDYYFGKEYYTIENGEKYINLILNIGSRQLLYKVSDATGEYYYASDIGPGVFAVTRDNVQVFAGVQCSIQQACYGPDSLIVQLFDPNPNIGGNPKQWSFGLKQNIRTAPIQGHYDFNNQDITTDADGNVYLLTQIDRWDFQFCTDCNDAFIDAYSEIFKFDTSGQLVKHFKLKTAISNMRFLPNAEGKLIVRIDDINASGTAVISGIYYVNPDLTLNHQITFDQQYNHIIVGTGQNLFTCTNVYDPTDPNIKGLSDVLVSKFNSAGVLQWKSYYGGTGFDYPKGIIQTEDGGLAFFVNTQSSDFDVLENHGDQDMWLVKLEENTTSVSTENSIEYSVYPNPASKELFFTNIPLEANIQIYDGNGKMVEQQIARDPKPHMMINQLPQGYYFIKIISNDKSGVAKFIKS
ncbi:MAG: T9SS type A sorting domain-containing protein [Saprospiraceae bacterium]